MELPYSSKWWCLWMMLLTNFTSLPELHSSQILGIFTVHAYSHEAFNQAIIRSLLSRGHNITVINYFESPSLPPNYTEILLERDHQAYSDNMPVDTVRQFNSVPDMFLITIRMYEALCETLFKLDYIRRLVESEEKAVDIIIVESSVMQCLNLLAMKLDIPVIITSALTSDPGHYVMIGNPSNPSYVPFVSAPVPLRMSFMERLLNTYHYTAFYFGHYWFFNNYVGRVARKYLNMEPPTVEELHNRVSLIFSNNHLSIIGRPSVPNLIDIAGIHIQQAKSLPLDIQQFIDDAKHGVIFFSFGTNLKASTIPPEKLNVITEVFSKIPQKVLWRINDPKIVNVPQNVRVAKWFPQRDLLEHANVRIFVTHCGIASAMEAIYTGTPVIAIPFFFDQFQNGYFLAEKGAGVHLDYYNLSVDQLLFAINEIINNTKYTENMQKLSAIFKDRPMTPQETVVYWVEYVLKYNGAPHLRTAAADIPLYQYLSLDIIVLVLTIPIATVWLGNLIRKLFSFLFLRKKQKSDLKHE